MSYAFAYKHLTTRRVLPLRAAGLDAADVFCQIDDFCRRLVYEMRYAIAYQHFDYASSAAPPIHADTADMFYHFDCASSAADTCRHRGHVLPCHLSGRLRRRRVGTSIRTLANEPEQPPLLRCLGCLLRAASPAPHGLPGRAVRCDDGYSGILPPRTSFFTCMLRVREITGRRHDPSSLHGHYRDPTVAPGG